MNQDITKTITDEWIALVRSRVMKTLTPTSLRFLNQLEAHARQTRYYQQADLLVTIYAAQHELFLFY